MELTAEQIKKALECCLYREKNIIGCSECPYQKLEFEDDDVCSEILADDAIELIKENELLCKILVERIVTLIEFDKTIGRLTEENEDLKAIAEQYQRQFEEAKADTVRKMQVQLKMEIDRFGRKDGFITKETVYWFIDQITKEMLEGEI